MDDWVGESIQSASVLLFSCPPITLTMTMTRVDDGLLTQISQQYYLNIYDVYDK